MRISLRADVLVTETDYGAVLLDEAEGQYWNLNPTGALILQALLAGGSPSEVARTLADSYGIAIETAAADVAELVTALESAKLITSCA